MLTYIRSDWGNNAGPIGVEEVAAKRKEFSAMTNPWTEAGLLALPEDSTTPPAPTATPPAKK